MKTNRPSLLFLAIAALCVPLLQASPVKIFILAGQSNMVGKGQISPATTPGTLDYTVANDTAGHYSFLKAGGANYVVRNDVWIRANGTTGGLTVGYGDGSTRIGPELGFGHRIGGLNEDRVLIVKVAKGGKSLGNDFLPPSSGPYATPVKDGDTGYWYAEILREVNNAITNLATYVPGYVPTDGYEIAGFGWHQGWNDRISATFSAAYETNMANFIRDIRSDLGVPGLPFVIATTAMDPETTYTQVELAQLAVATYPEFAGNVATIDCRSTYDGMVFWQRAGRSPRDEGYHWNFNAKTYLNIGLSMGDAMSLMAPGRCPIRLKASGAPGGGVSLVWKNGTETPVSVRILRNGSEIAAAVPGSTTTFLDSATLPGSHTYQLEFTMPVTACPPLTTTFNGGVTGLALSRTTGDFVLSWNNNMAYTGIEVRRDGTLLGSPLSGTATTFTDPSPPATGNVTYTVTPTTGTPTPANVTTNLDLRGQLNVLDVATANGGINPTTGNPWQAGEQYRLIFASKPTSSAASTDIATYNTFVQNVATAAGLGAATWKVLGSTQTVAARDNTGTNNGLAVGVPVILMDGTTVFADNNNDLWGGANSNGSGGTVTPIYHEDGTLIAANSRVWTGTNSNGTIASQYLGSSGVGFGTPTSSGATQWILVYGANNATTLPLYALSEPLTIQAGPDTTPPTVVSIADNKSGGPILASDMVTYTVTFSEPMNASTVDVTDFINGGSPPATIQSVSPTGDPAVFLVNVIPGGAGTLKLQIAAAAVLQDQSNRGLVTNPVVADDTIITVNAVNADSIPPSPNPMSWASPPAAGGSSITMTATAANDPSGVEYYFAETSGNPGANDSGWQTSPIYTDTGLSPETSYSYTVTARDQSANHNASAPSASASATTLPLPSGPGGAVIYEPFDNSDSTLTGNTPGTGLAGTWATSGTTWNVAGPSLGYGSLPTSGNRASNGARGAHSITTGTVGSNTLLDAGLLNHGQTLWFSFLWKMDDSAVSNGDAAFVLGTHTLTGGANNGMPMTPAGTGSGIGVSMSTSNGTLTAGSWTLGARTAGTPSVAWGDRSVAKLIVGKIIWGADASANDTITIYLPGADLALPLAPVSSKTAVLDQSVFNTISFATKTEGDPQIDEIRFGATYDDAVGMGGAGNSYANWADLFLPAVIGGLTLDFDGDGQPNGVENFFGTAPNVFSQGLVAGTLNGNQFTFTHPQGVLADDLTATYKWSKDLVAFYPEGPGDGTTVSFAMQANTPSEGFTTVTATVTGAATGKLFLIVQVTQAP